MRIFNFTVVFCTLLAACYGYTCPNDGNTFYHADVSTECQVYHFCESSEMTTLTCPPGQAFDHHTNQCHDASLVHCAETEHHQHKRSVDIVYSISIDELKNSTKEALIAMKSVFKKTFQETAPTIFNCILTDLVPIIESVKTNFEPLFKNYVLPRLEKFYVEAKVEGEKIYKKIILTYKLSNSTHINLVSFDDELDGIINRIQPILKLGQFYASRQVKNNKAHANKGHNLHKRSVEEVYSVSVNQLKNTSKEVFKGIKHTFSIALQKSAPTVFDRIQTKYAPIIKSLISDLEIVSKQNVLPRLEKLKVYAKQMGGKIFKKVQQSYEISNSTHINLLSFSDEMNEISSDIQPLLKLGKYFGSRLVKTGRIKREVLEDISESFLSSIETAHTYHKRSIEVVHSVSIAELKIATKEMLKSFKSIAKNAIQETAPAIYNLYETDYAPIIKSLKDEYESIAVKQVLPRIEKLYIYSQRIGGKLVHKLHRSYELSNSTHINMLSISNEIEEMYNDAQPFLKLARYFSSRLIKNGRMKRETGTPITDVPEYLIGYLEPVLKGMFASMTSMFSGNENTLTSRVIMPVLLEMMNDEETMLDVKKIFWSSKAAFSPLVFDMLNRQSFHNEDGTVIRIPQEKITQAKNYFYQETKPLIKELCLKHLPSLLLRCSENTNLIFGAIDRVTLLSTKGNGLVLRDSIIRFVRKHANILQSPSSDFHISSFALSEIKQDLRPIEIGILQMAVDYVDQLEDSWLKIFFGRNSILTQSFLGGRETYAVPSGSHQSASRPSSRTQSQTFAVPRKTQKSAPRPSSRTQSQTFAVLRQTLQSASRPSSRKDSGQSAVPSRIHQNSARPSPRRETPKGGVRLAEVSDLFNYRYRQALQG